MRVTKLLAVACLALAGNAVSAGETIYVSYDANGIPSYSTQPYDKQYSLFLKAERTTGQIDSKVVQKPGLPSRQAKLAPTIKQAAAALDIDPALVSAVIDVESGFNPQAVSPKGARGAMQLVPATAVRYGVTDVMDPQQNVQAGARYLKDLLISNNGNLALALAAYNAGPGNVRRHNDRIPHFSETMLYVPQVLARMEAYRQPDGAVGR